MGGRLAVERPEIQVLERTPECLLLARIGSQLARNSRLLCPQLRTFEPRYLSDRGPRVEILLKIYRADKGTQTLRRTFSQSRDIAGDYRAWPMSAFVVWTSGLPSEADVLVAVTDFRL